MKFIYIGLGFLFFGLGAVGVVLPVLPTTPFLLLAAFFFAKGSARFNTWFLSTKLYKKYLHEFIQHREMSLKSKISILSFASTMLIIAFILTDLLFLRIFIGLVIIYKYYFFVTKIKTKREVTSCA
ncbi:uncharacterized membrane protein YbaN (DUF454 family) [Paenibacillus turicensis]|uniref:Uncharacterized membrane protein YbaN (DUF454 family) n=1 Tax=Paenibacillus turicensis TaxID=160487 RepID=A0ABS4FYR4_9BACL|nr:YbaN family protein [Paenibacillus turicensis]MBP1907716.1 uncharacterized membrane protein YbaN (DUF454 family) [Paenibacillus turicensis]